MSVLKTLLKIVVFLLIVAGLYIGYLFVVGEGNAKISGMTPSGVASEAGCWVDFEFKNTPAGIDPMDAKIVFSGPLLVTDKLEYRWDFIGAHAQTPRKVGTGWEKATDVSPSAPPPLNTPFSVSFPVPIKSETMSDNDFDVTATLYWGGRKQSSDIGSFRYQYRAK
jgi:hypothetical protein